MRLHSDATRVRATALLAAVPATGLLLAYAVLPLLVTAQHVDLHGSDPSALPDLMAGLCALAALVAWAWLAAAVVACTWARVRRTTAPGRWVPRAVRLLVAAALGAAGTCLVVPQPAGARTDPHHLLDGLRVPTRTVGAIPHRHPSGRTVRPGDTLWALAADSLPAGAAHDEGAIDRAWRLLYRVNREAVGPDPDLILPGTRLILPRRPVPSTHPGDPR